MKKYLCIAIVLMLVIVSFRSDTDKSLASVDRVDGYYIFIMSKPEAKYEYMGSVNKSIALTGKPEEMFKGIIKKIKKEYPRADAIMFTSIELDKADAIKFKE